MTYFEPAHARKVFPCFDEPLFKSSFNISIIHDPEPYYALSNMPRDRCVVREDGLVETHFAPSVNMSSYLVAFAVVDFKYKESKTDSGVLVSCLVASKCLFGWSGNNGCIYTKGRIRRLKRLNLTASKRFI